MVLLVSLLITANDLGTLMGLSVSDAAVLEGTHARTIIHMNTDIHGDTLHYPLLGTRSS